MKMSKCFLNFFWGRKELFSRYIDNILSSFQFIKNLLSLENPRFSCWIRFLLKISFKDKRKDAVKRETSSISWILSHEYRENFLRSLYIFPLRENLFSTLIRSRYDVYIRIETCSESYCNIGWSWKERSYLFYTL